MRPWSKFICQFLAALPFAIWGENVSWVEFFGFHVALGTFLGAGLTALWLVACANTINLIDGLDGLAGTVGLIAAVGIAAVADMRQLPAVAAVAIIVAGSLSGFLCHNLPPARIFLGDSGSLLIGFLIGALSIESSLKTATGFAMTIPLILVSIPAFDTFMAIMRRRLTGRGIGEGDCGHIHHRLQERGLTRPQALLVIASLCAAMTLLAVASVFLRSDRLCALLCLGFLGLLIAGRVFGHHEALLMTRRLARIGQLLFSPPRRGREAQTAMREPTWEAAIARVRPWGVSRLDLTWFDVRSNQVVDTTHWRDDSQVTTWEIRVGARASGRRQLVVAAFGTSRRASATEQAAVFGVLDDCCRRWAALGHVPREATTDQTPTILSRPNPATDPTSRPPEQRVA